MPIISVPIRTIVYHEEIYRCDNPGCTSVIATRIIDKNHRDNVHRHISNRFPSRTTATCDYEVHNQYYFCSKTCKKNYTELFHTKKLTKPELLDSDLDNDW